MKPETITATATAQDRVATWEEIRRATVATPDRIMELFYTSGTHCEVDSESGGRVRFPAEEFEFFAYLSEAQSSDAN
jgi:hypothetical protein